MSTDQLARRWASSNSLEAYGDKLSNKDDFYEGLKAAFTVEDQFYCAPKDFSTLALFINKKMWADAGGLTRSRHSEDLGRPQQRRPS